MHEVGRGNGMEERSLEIGEVSSKCLLCFICMLYQFLVLTKSFMNITIRKFCQKGWVDMHLVLGGLRGEAAAIPIIVMVHVRDAECWCDSSPGNNLLNFILTGI